MQHVDEQQFTPSGHLHNTRDDTIEHTRQQKERHRQRLERPTKCCIRVAAVVPYQDDGGQTKQIEQMHTDGKARHISNEDEVSVGMWLVGMFLPFQDEPEHNGREERREGIHLTLNRREPKRIRETIDECADKACQQPLRSKLREFRKVLSPLRYESAASRRAEMFFARRELPNEMGDGPEEKHHRCCRQQCIHEVHHISHLGLVSCQLRDDVGGKHIKRCSRRMTHFQFISTQDELRTIPKRGGGFQGRNIRESGDGKYHPSYSRIGTSIIKSESFHTAKVRPLPFVRRKKSLTIV